MTKPKDCDCGCPMWEGIGEFMWVCGTCGAIWHTYGGQIVDGVSINQIVDEVARVFETLSRKIEFDTAESIKGDGGCNGKKKK